MIRVANVADAPQLAEIYTQRFGETSARAAMVVVVSSCRDQGLLMRSAINVRKWSTRADGGLPANGGKRSTLAVRADAILIQADGNH